LKNENNLEYFKVFHFNKCFMLLINIIIVKFPFFQLLINDKKMENTFDRVKK